MRLTMREKSSVTKVIAGRYKKASKKEKKIILDEFINLTSYNIAHSIKPQIISAKLWRPPGQPRRTNAGNIGLGRKKN